VDEDPRQQTPRAGCFQGVAPLGGPLQLRDTELSRQGLEGRRLLLRARPRKDLRELDALVQVALGQSARLGLVLGQDGAAPQRRGPARGDARLGPPRIVARDRVLEP